MCKKYVKKAISVEAFQYKVDDEPDWFNPIYVKLETNPETSEKEFHAAIHTLEGDMWFWEGDFIVKGPFNDIYPCRKDIFLSTYEEVQNEKTDESICL